MRLIDTHAHMGFSELLKDINGIIARADREGVAIVNCCLSPQELEKTKGFKKLYLTIGCTPYHLQDFERQYQLIEANIDRIIAVGEIGLDYYWIKEKEGRERERENFQKLLQLAGEYDKPVIIHSRNAERPALDMLEKADVHAIMHCFSGSLEEARRAIDLGYLISIPTNIGRSVQKQGFARSLPLESLVLETDAPYLPPIPKTINEPVNVIHSAHEIARIRDIEFADVVAQTTRNARKFFGI